MKHAAVSAQLFFPRSFSLGRVHVIIHIMNNAQGHHI
jgi:hypothetical protein